MASRNDVFQGTALERFFSHFGSESSETQTTMSSPFRSLYSKIYTDYKSLAFKLGFHYIVAAASTYSSMRRSNWRLISARRGPFVTNVYQGVA